MVGAHIIIVHVSNEVIPKIFFRVALIDSGHW